MGARAKTRARARIRRTDSGRARAKVLARVGVRTDAGARREATHSISCWEQAAQP